MSFDEKDQYIQELEEMIRRVYDQGLVITVTKKDFENYETVFSGCGCTASAKDFIMDQIHAAMFYANKMRELREGAAMSGAMRWPWSQEASIVMKRSLPKFL